MHVKTLLGSVAVIAGVLALLGVTGSEATHTPVAVAIDVDVSGNSANSLGTTEACNAVGLAVGETLDIDVVVRDVPEYEPSASSGHGIAGFTFNLVFDPEVISVDRVHAYSSPTILEGQGAPFPFVVLDYDYGNRVDNPPGTTGDVRVDVADLSNVYESGDGVLTRVTIRAVRDGITAIELHEELARVTPPTATVYEAGGGTYPSSSTQAVVGVGQNGCSGPPPPPVVTRTPKPFSTLTPTPSGSPHPTPTQAPIRVFGIGLNPSQIRVTERTRVAVTGESSPPGVKSAVVSLRFDSAVASVECISNCVVDQSHGTISIARTFDPPHATPDFWDVGQFYVTIARTGTSKPVEITSATVIDAEDNDAADDLIIYRAYLTAFSATPQRTASPSSTPTPTPSPLTPRPTATPSVTTQPTSTGTRSPAPMALPPTGGRLERDGIEYELLGFAVLMLAVSFGVGVFARRRE